MLLSLARTRGPVSAAEIHEHLGSSVPLSSIYRTLTVLDEHGICSPHHGRDGITRHELAEPLQQHHHHLVCIECGSIDDVHFDSTAEHSVTGAIARVAADHDFQVVDHALEIEGRCRRCA